MRVPGLRTLARTATRIRSRIQGASLILRYHRIADEEFDPWEMCVTAAHFSEQLEVIRELGTALAVRDLVAGLGSKRAPNRRIAITFDDGYVDNLTVALPLLDRAGLSAAFFLTTGFLGREFWWDELNRLLVGSKNLPNRIELSGGKRAIRWDLVGGPAELHLRHRLLESVHHHLMTLGSHERDEAMAQLRVQIPEVLPTRLDRRAMSADEVVQLSMWAGAEIGAHSVSHCAFPVLDADAQRDEIRKSREMLADLVGAKVVGFSYPHGQWSPGTPGLIRDAGFAYACTSANDGVRRPSDRFLLPRVFPGNVGGDRFRSWLRGWLG